MSRPRNESPRAVVSGPEGAAPKGPMTLTGVVRTTRGFAVAIATLEPDGSVRTVKLTTSQTHKQFVALEHKRAMTAAVQSA